MRPSTSRQSRDITTSDGIAYCAPMILCSPRERNKVMRCADRCCLVGLQGSCQASLHYGSATQLHSKGLCFDTRHAIVEQLAFESAARTCICSQD